MKFNKTETLHTITVSDNDLFVISNAIEYYLNTKEDIYPYHKEWYEKTLKDLQTVFDETRKYQYEH